MIFWIPQPFLLCGKICEQVGLFQLVIVQEQQTSKWKTEWAQRPEKSLQVRSRHSTCSDSISLCSFFRQDSYHVTLWMKMQKFLFGPTHLTLTLSPQKTKTKERRRATFCYSFSSTFCHITHVPCEHLNLKPNKDACQCQGRVAMLRAGGPCQRWWQQQWQEHDF